MLENSFLSIKEIRAGRVVATRNNLLMILRRNTEEIPQITEKITAKILWRLRG